MTETISNSGKTTLPWLLVVDDEIEFMGFVREALEGEFEVKTARSTSEAEIHLGLRAFDVVLADHLMPGGMGLEFLMRTREHFPKMKRILMTGSLSSDLISRAQELADLSSYLIKPITIKQLRRALLRALAH